MSWKDGSGTIRTDSVTAFSVLFLPWVYYLILTWAINWVFPLFFTLFCFVLLPCFKFYKEWETLDKRRMISKNFVIKYDCDYSDLGCYSASTGQGNLQMNCHSLDHLKLAVYEIPAFSPGSICPVSFWWQRWWPEWLCCLNWRQAEYVYSTRKGMFQYIVYQMQPFTFWSMQIFRPLWHRICCAGEVTSHGLTELLREKKTENR